MSSYKKERVYFVMILLIGMGWQFFVTGIELCEN
jgi:hypothetical protein